MKYRVRKLHDIILSNTELSELGVDHFSNLAKLAITTFRISATDLSRNVEEDNGFAKWTRSSSAEH